MKSLMYLFYVLLDECGQQCSVSTTRDRKTISRRVEDEGFSFITITLANFGKDFEKSLSQGCVSHDLFQGFSWRGGLPKFLSGFLGNVFNSKDGCLLDDPDVQSIQSIRQLCFAMEKINMPCTPERELSAIRQYIQCEQDVRFSDQAISDSHWSEFSRTANLLFAELFSELNHAVDNLSLVPRHGPGGTADDRKGNQKWHQDEWPRRLEEYFPLDLFLAPNPRYAEQVGKSVNILEPRDERPVRVISVPKTQKTPRIIALEPTAMQYAQQSLLKEIVAGMERHDFLLQLLGWKGFGRDMSVLNHNLARLGSLNSSFATLDLSEASDRVSNQHVLQLFKSFPSLLGAVQACRSRKADVPGVGVIRLAKYASMGSALTFPIEAMVFTTIIFMAIGSTLNHPLTRRDILSLTGQVRVFGDDIIVPKDYALVVYEYLEAFGLRVNRRKTFIEGNFRESCGKEYYNGEDVTVFRFRRELPSAQRECDRIVSLAETRNHAYKHGYWMVARAIDSFFDRMGWPFPVVGERASGIGRNSFLGYESQRMCDKLHRPLVKAMVPTFKWRRESRLEDVPALTKLLTEAGVGSEETDPWSRKGLATYYRIATDSVSSLERSGRPSQARTTVRWISPF